MARLIRKTKGGGIPALRRRVKPGAIKVGVLDGVKHPHGDGITVAQVMAYNEFGTETIPERSMLRHTLRTKRRKYVGVMKKLTGKIIKGELSALQARGILGEVVQSDVQKRIVELREPPNAASTIAKKKSSNPLMDSGTMRQSVRWGTVNASILRRRNKRSTIIR